MPLFFDESVTRAEAGVARFFVGVRLAIFFTRGRARRSCAGGAVLRCAVAVATESRNRLGELARVLQPLDNHAAACKTLASITLPLYLELS